MQTEISAVYVKFHYPPLLLAILHIQWNKSGGNGYNEWVLSVETVNCLLDKPIVSTPGTTFNYNSAVVHLLGVILVEASDMSLPDFASQYLFGKIGIETSAWEKADEIHANGGSGIRLKSQDMAKLGQLMLQGGKSGDEQFQLALAFPTGKPVYYRTGSS